MGKKNKDTLLKILAMGGPFILGLVFFLAVGWLLFPMLLYSQKEQAIAFPHTMHSRYIDCVVCHKSGPGESIAPGIEVCSSCHQSLEDRKGSSDEETRLITEYVMQGKEINWLYHQTQPDNVYFSHVAHSLETCATPSCHPYWLENTDAFCSTCHLPAAEIDSVPLEFNRVTGYSRQIMKMDVCENCHASPSHLKVDGLTDEQERALLEGRPKLRLQANASNACFTCHK